MPAAHGHVAPDHWTLKGSPAGRPTPSGSGTVWGTAVRGWRAPTACPYPRLLKENPSGVADGSELALRVQPQMWDTLSRFSGGQCAPRRGWLPVPAKLPAWFKPNMSEMRSALRVATRYCFALSGDDPCGQSAMRVCGNPTRTAAELENRLRSHPPVAIYCAREKLLMIPALRSGNIRMSEVKAVGF